jgi:copper chaperone CopZ
MQPVSFFGLLHDCREALASYLIGNSDENECNRTSKEAYEQYAKYLDEAISNYFERTKQSIQTKSEKFMWEAVINLEQHHTLSDVKKLTKKLEEKYGWREVQVSVHKDEGHVSEVTGEIFYNYHAHAIFFMLNSQGIYCFKKRDFRKKQMAELQTLVARELGMERGISKLISKKERLSHSQYRQVKEEQQELRSDLEMALIDVDLFQNAYIEENKKLLDMQDKVIYSDEIIRQQQEKIDHLEKINFENSKVSKEELTITSTLFNS